MKQRTTGWVTRIKARRRWTAAQWLRLMTQIGFLAATAYAIVRHRMGEDQGLVGPANPAPSVDALSPLGGLETLWQWTTTGRVLNHLQISDLVLLVAAVLLALFLGGAFCGWICPLGAIQEWLYRLRARLIPWKITVPEKADRILRYGRYLVLALVLWGTIYTAGLVFADFCPWRTGWHLGSSEMAIGGAIVLGLLVMGGLLIERAWCRYACPLGALMGLFNKLAPVKLHRTASACPACALCNRRCPMDLPVAQATHVSDTTCIRCLECVDVCPKPEALSVRAGWWENAKRVKGWAYGLVTVAIFAGVIGLSMGMGEWQSTPSAAVAQVDQTSGAVAPDEIRGWRSLQEVIDIWGIPKSVLYGELGLDPATPTTKLVKDLESMTSDKGLTMDRNAVVDVVTRWQKGELQ